MPVKDLIGQRRDPIYEARRHASMMAWMTRLMPELDWWPRLKRGDDDGDALPAIPPSGPRPISGADAASPDDEAR